MGLSKSKRKPNYNFKGEKPKYIHYISFIESTYGGNMCFLLMDENGKRHDINIPMQELLMTKCINIEKLTALIDKKIK